MPVLELSEAELGLIEELVRREHEAMASEIHYTDSRTVKEALRARRAMLAEILDHLGTPQAS